MQPFNNEILTPATNNDWATVHVNEHDDWINDGIAEPTLAELNNFLNQAQNKATNQEQLDTVDFIGTTAIHPLQGSPARTIAYQTALRTVDPDSIWQGPYGFCGPAAIAYYFAKHWPRKYAECIVSLQNTGTGTLRLQGAHAVLHADANWNTTYQNAGLATTKMGPADFLILHAIRRAAEYGIPSFDVTHPGQGSDATPAHKMKKFLEDAGYRDVTNKTLWYGPLVFPERDWHSLTYIRELQVLTNRVDGPLVIMLVHPALATLQWRDFQRPQQLSNLHWICVDSLKRAGAGTGYEMSFMSYAERGNGTYSEEQFRKCFYGYISAMP